MILHSFHNTFTRNQQEVSEVLWARKIKAMSLQVCPFLPLHWVSNGAKNLHSGFVISDNPKQSSRVPVFIKVLDVNDNAPEFAMFYETFVCENAKAEQVCCLLILRKYSKLNEFCYNSCIASSSGVLCIASNLIAKLNSACTVSDFTQYSSSWHDGMFLNVIFCTLLPLVHFHSFVLCFIHICKCYRSCLWYNYILLDNSQPTTPIVKKFKADLEGSAKQFLWHEIWVDEYKFNLDCLTFHLYSLSHAKVSYPSAVALTQVFWWNQHDFSANFQIHNVTLWWYRI